MKTKEIYEWQQTSLSNVDKEIENYSAYLLPKAPMVARILIFQISLIKRFIAMFFSFFDQTL